MFSFQLCEVSSSFQATKTTQEREELSSSTTF
jgi:hypothetical protein